MTIDEAIQVLINSEPFKEKAKKDAKLRVYLRRIKAGTDNMKTKQHLLESFGYIVTTTVKIPS